MEIRPMTFDEFDEYQDFVEELEEKGIKPSKVSRKAGAWIMDKIYKVNVHDTDITPGKIMSVVSKTIEMTFKNNEEEEKN